MLQCALNLARRPRELQVDKRLQPNITSSACRGNEGNCLALSYEQGCRIMVDSFFVSGTNSMINSRNCTLQQSSKTAGISVYMESVTAKCVVRHVGVSYACGKCCFTIGFGWVLTYCKL